MACDRAIESVLCEVDVFTSTEDIPAHGIGVGAGYDRCKGGINKGPRREWRGPLTRHQNQLCQRNCCGLRAEPCEITTLTRAGPRKFIASSRTPRRSFGSSTKKPLPPKASITLS